MDSRHLEKLKVPSRYNVEQLIAKEFPKLRDEHYLDHAAATLYSTSQLHAVFTELESSLLGNPHSRHQPSDTTTQIIESIRQRILEHFNTSAENYDVIFTSGATAAIKVIAQSFDWGGHNQVSQEAGSNSCCTSQENSKGQEGHFNSQNASDSERRNGIKKHQDQVWNGNVKESRKERTNCECFRGDCLEGHKQLWDGNVSESGKERNSGQFKRESFPAYSHHFNQHYEKTDVEDGDTYPGAFVYTRENHTSVLGVRELAHQAGCDVYSVSTEEIRNIIQDRPHRPACTQSSALENVAHVPTPVGKAREEDCVNECNRSKMRRNEADNNSSAFVNTAKHKDKFTHDEKTKRGHCEIGCRRRKRNCLFAFSGQCNFSGAKFPLSWIDKVQAGVLNCILNSSPINSTSGKGKDERCTPKWFVLLDAAGLVATSPLDLSHYCPDFVPISFYKLFGYPTGLGCLLVSQRAWGIMRKSYQGGGTIMVADSRTMTLIPRPVLHERFEDGTLPYLSILAVRHGLDTLATLTGGMERVRDHTFHLARYTHHSLRSLRHACGSPVVRVHCPWGDDTPWHHSTHGPIINFSLLEADGSHVGYARVERVATLYNIYLRTGCLCNPGACQTHLNISEEQLLQQFEAGHVCGDARDLVDGLPTGSVRVSFGYMSTYTDADQLLRMVRECFVQGTPHLDTTWMTGRLSDCDEDLEARAKNGIRNGESLYLPSPAKELQGTVTQQQDSQEHQDTENDAKPTDHQLSLDGEHQDTVTQLQESKEYQKGKEDKNCTDIHQCLSQNGRLQLTDIFLYPVKSCGGQRAEEWAMGCSGLEYDRGWMVVTEAGVTLTLKRAPRMALILPLVDLDSQMLVLRCKGKKDMKVPLDPESAEESEAGVCGGRVCGDRVRGWDCGVEVGQWLSQVLETPGLRLMKQTTHRSGRLSSHSQSKGGEVREKLSLANESQVLVLHRPSVRHLQQEIVARGLEDQLTEDELVRRFRPNLVVEGGEVYEEDSWPTLTINNTTLQIQSKCRRCQMVCVSPTTGQRSKEPMLTLTNTRGSNMWFGVHATTITNASDDATTTTSASATTTVPLSNTISVSATTFANATATSPENIHKKIISAGSPVYTFKMQHEE